jgi:hypothetical protein
MAALLPPVHRAVAMILMEVKEREWKDPAWRMT